MKDKKKSPPQKERECRMKKEEEKDEIGSE